MNQLSPTIMQKRFAMGFSKNPLDGFTDNGFYNYFVH
jgi:hypothetical protein